jgi:hypothetical protein
MVAFIDWRYVSRWNNSVGVLSDQSVYPFRKAVSTPHPIDQLFLSYELFNKFSRNSLLSANLVQDVPLKSG